MLSKLVTMRPAIHQAAGHRATLCACAPGLTSPTPPRCFAPTACIRTKPAATPLPRSGPEHPVQAGIVTNFGANYLSLTFPRRKNTDVNYVVEVAPDLSRPAAWATGGMQIGSPVSLNAGFEEATVRDPVPMSSAVSRFMGLKVRTP